MSEKPISLIDDEKSSQVTYNTDKILNDRESQRAFFEQAESQIAPPTFEKFNLQEELQVFDSSILQGDNEGFVQPPEFAQPPKTYEDNLREMIYALETDRQAFDYLVSNTRAVYLMRPLN